MFSVGKYATAAFAVALCGAASLPTQSSTASALPQAAVVEATQHQAIEPSPAPLPPVAPAPTQAPVAADEPAAEPEQRPARRATASSEIDRELECLAKVVLHEAGNQSRAGQIAVAEVVMNRLQDPRRRFGRTICGVVLQRGQFFNVNAYHPQRDRRWPRAVAIARQVRADMQEGDHDHVTNGGLFFRAHYGAPFRGRTRVATIGDHAFYR